MEATTLGTCRELESLYSSLLVDVKVSKQADLTVLKSGSPIWEDIIGKGGKLFAALRYRSCNIFL